VILPGYRARKARHPPATLRTLRMCSTRTQTPQTCTKLLDACAFDRSLAAIHTGCSMSKTSTTNPAQLKPRDPILPRLLLVRSIESPVSYQNSAGMYKRHHRCTPGDKKWRQASAAAAPGRQKLRESATPNTHQPLQPLHTNPIHQPTHPPKPTHPNSCSLHPVPCKESSYQKGHHPM
jgi:hypothetical protein